MSSTRDKNVFNFIKTGFYLKQGCVEMRKRAKGFTLISVTNSEQSFLF